MNTRLLTAALLTGAVFTGGCSAGLRTQVHTLSDAIPASNASYALILTDAQSADIEAVRQARTVRANLVRQGYIETDADKAAYHVRFVVTDTGTSDDGRDKSRLSVYYPTTHSTTSQTTVAGIGVPGTQRTTVHSDPAVGYTDDIASRKRDRHLYRAEISFLEHDGSDAKPVHKIVAEAESRKGALSEIAPCLIDAAFRAFPDSDESKRSVTVDTASCS